MMTRSIMLVLALAGLASATDHPQVARKLVLRDARGRSSLVWSTRLPPPALPAASPLGVGGTLRVVAEGGESATFDLPAAGWSANPTATAFSFKNGAAPAGPSAVRVASLKGLRSLKVAAKSSGLSLDEATQGVVRIELTIGSDVYCSTCTAPLRDQPGRYAARDCSAPAACAGVGATTTSSSTSTTFVPNICGNGVIDPPSEQCDGANVGTCAAAPLFFNVGCQPPGHADECTCCGQDHCAVSLTFHIDCCGSSQCQITTPIGMERTGACIPPTCTTDADCHDYRCVGGTCCGNAGQLCGVAGCCADSGTTCEYVPSVFINLCCKAAGIPCGAFSECCSLSCTAGVCD